MLCRAGQVFFGRQAALLESFFSQAHEAHPPQRRRPVDCADCQVLTPRIHDPDDFHELGLAQGPSVGCRGCRQQDAHLAGLHRRHAGHQHFLGYRQHFLCFARDILELRLEYGEETLFTGFHS